MLNKFFIVNIFNYFSNNLCDLIGVWLLFNVVYFLLFFAFI
jgi:hypothetical protein